VKKVRVIYLALFVLFGLAAKAQEKQPLKLLVTTPLPGFQATSIISDRPQGQALISHG